MEEIIVEKKYPTLPRIGLKQVKEVEKNRIKKPTEYMESLNLSSDKVTIIEDQHLLFRIKTNGKFTLDLKSGSNSSRGRKKFCYLDDDKIYNVYKDHKVKGTLMYIKSKREIHSADGPMILILEGIILAQAFKYFGYNMTQTLFKKNEVIYEQKHIYGYGEIVRDL